MKKLYIVANWKANKTVSETKEWIQKVARNKQQVTSWENKEVIVCPGFQLLSTVKALIEDNGLPFKLGSQDVSGFGMGAYTGEVAAEQLKEFVTYTLIGHSERRKYLHESESMIDAKASKALSVGLTSIACVQGSDIKIPTNVQIVAYEPVFAIGTGTPDTPENADTVAEKIKHSFDVMSVLYGGSVTSENVNQFTSKPNIDGVLVGGASLNAEEFLGIINNA